ncbi:MAG TPA: anti-sigma factor [Methylomirabilota bacterium]|nr:anti-sigma factor [Methylomirabilota bacterium]
MTCQDARELLSALLDEALPASERQELDGHLAGCAECRRELDGLRETVALLGGVPSVHAPAGFVDRVMAEAYRPSWARRALDALFRPLRVKLPLEAAAVLLVGVSALYIYQRSPEVRELARQESRESSPAPAVTPSASAPPAAPREAGEPSRFRDLAPDAKRAPAEQGAAREEARQAPPAVSPPAPAPSPAQRGNVQEAPAAKPEASPARKQASTDSSASPESKVKREMQAKLEKEAQDAGRADSGAAPRPPTPGKVAQSAERSVSGHAAGATGGAAPSSAEPATPPAVPPAPASGARDRVGAAASAPAPPAGSEADDLRSTAKSSAAARLTRAVDASGRLAVPAREPAEMALDALLRRLGATPAARRFEGTQGMLLIDVVVPGARYRELLEGLGRIGRWVTEYEVTTLPAQVRVEVALIVEP